MTTPGFRSKDPSEIANSRAYAVLQAEFGFALLPRDGLAGLVHGRVGLRGVLSVLGGAQRSSGGLSPRNMPGAFSWARASARGAVTTHGPALPLNHGDHAHQDVRYGLADGGKHVEEGLTFRAGGQLSPAGAMRRTARTAALRTPSRPLARLDAPQDMQEF